MTEREVPEWVVTEIERLRQAVEDINMRLVDVESLLAHLALPFSSLQGSPSSSSSPEGVRLVCDTRVVGRFPSREIAEAYARRQGLPPERCIILAGSSSSPERQYGIPKTDVERVASHYGVSREAAEKMIREVGVERLLPERGLRVRVAGIAEELSPCNLKCPFCGAEIPEGWDFCPVCHVPILRRR